MIFSYEAKDTTGETITGALEADNERAAANLIREMGYYPMRFVATQGVINRIAIPAERQSIVVTPANAVHGSIESIRPGEKLLRAVVYPLATGVTLKDIAIMYRSLGAMLNAGVTMNRAFDALTDQLPLPTLRYACRDIARSISAGAQLSQAMARFPYLFAEMHIEFVQSAEMTGGVGDILITLADYCEQDFALRQMVKKETFYPKIVFAMSFLLPNLVVMVISGAQAYIRTAVMPLIELIGLLGVGAVVFRYANQSSTFRYIFDTFKSYIPYFGKTVRLLAIAKFSRAMAALYSAGVLIPNAMEISARVAGNQYLSNMIMKSVETIKQGGGLARSLQMTGVFPPMFISMVSTGEETGNLDGMLKKIADFYEDDAKARLHASVMAMTQLMFIIVACIVGAIVIKFYAGQASQILNM